ncbi:sperm acrosome membrane-associated protein 4 [Engraulis encrasicolus]|uniref:sperm acrosome membrane-associated protein 4 n=1 Tax=Engraulis encrasicolus TaxID=184585 RepID=UPI002FD2D120
MNRIILGIFAVTMCFAIGQALQCYKCDIGLWDVCYTTKTTCGANEQCYTGVGKAAGFIQVRMKGCLASAECNKTSDVNFPTDSNTTVYSMTKTCCEGELCNAAPGLPRMGTLPLALATLLTLLTAKALV